MPVIEFPYGKEYMIGEIPEERFGQELLSSFHDYVPSMSQEELVKNAMANPVGSKTLKELAVGKKNVVLIASDHTRPVPSKVIVPFMLQEIREGNPDADITILISTGCHRETTVEELRAKFGDEIVNTERIYVHDCDDEKMLVDVDILPSGGKLRLNRLAMEADLLVSEGFIEPHFFAGFSGGRKSVLPGVASRVTVLENHCSKFIASAGARTGILEGNDIHKDMIFAARRAKLAYIVNVIINSRKEVVHAVAGDCNEAHLAGVEFLRQYCQVKAKPADIVITTNGGYPLDQNIYQAVKGLTAAEMAVKQGGVIIMLARSNDGHGGEQFYADFAGEKDINKLMERYLATDSVDTKPDQWQSQILVRVLQRAKVVYISDAPDEMVEAFGMLPAHSIAEAIAKADQILGHNHGIITAIPDGVSVVVAPEE